MKSMRVGLIAIALAEATLPAQPAKASIDSGNDLLTACTGSQAGFEDGLCMGFIQGVTVGIVADHVINNKIRMPYCVRPGVTLGQLDDVVVAYLKAHPANRDTTAASIVLAAIEDAYPCQKPL